MIKECIHFYLGGGGHSVYINMQYFCPLLHTSDLRANTLWHENRALNHGYTNPGRQNLCTVGPKILGNSRTLPVPPNSTPTVVST